MVSMTTDLNNRFLQVPQYASSYDFTAGNAPLMTVSGLRRTVEAITDSTKTLVAADSGKIFTLDRAAGITITLPAAAAGYFFDFIVTTTFTGTWQIDAASSADTLQGGCWIVDKDNVDSHVATNAGATVGWSTPAAADHQFVASGDTLGRFIGSRLTYLAASASIWMVDGVVFGDGTLALPFT